MVFLSVGFRNPHLRLRGRFRFFLLLWGLEQFACPRVTGTFRLCVCRNLTKEGIDKALSRICSDMFWRSSVANHVSRLEQIQGDRLIREPEEEILPGRGCRPGFGWLFHQDPCEDHLSFSRDIHGLDVPTYGPHAGHIGFNGIPGICIRRESGDVHERIRHCIVRETRWKG
nr:MAG TPA: hypothetical protein [Caudoviricetes sp.]